MSKLNMLVSVIIGSFIGAVLGVLFAPDKGERTRKQLSKKSDEYTDMVRSEFDDFVKTMRKKYETALDDTEDIINKGKSKAEDLRNEVKKAMK
ncbi:YtxH domain-containing protein [Natronogracilivirga saccharolytica]|uniref:YtxH domain-containing protein n=1 Tax=Natronogracilivirga saccharolytica TaxID=2812953 RepID=A0A8J7RLA1_9BACT|nr:YtxH domain-containing protein [Natronogracilivirga saccharolytica]MBP3193765.1 YtxH domain-containing protein [Natronogracilivirga saccharolytica]